MAKYEVVRPWFGVKAGQVVEIDSLNRALKSNVRLLVGEVAELTPATPGATSGVEKSATKKEVAERLKELDIKFDGRASLEELIALLPDGDSLKPASEE